MSLHPFSASYSASQNTYNVNPMLSGQLNQQTLSAQQLAQLATASRAKRLTSLLEKLEDLIVTAAAAGGNNTTQNQADYLAYVLARLGGEENLDTPETLGEFAYEMDDLIDDVLAAWEALQLADDLGDDLPETTQFQSLDGILAMLDHIAQRRVNSLMANHWYTQWRQIYRDLVEGGEAEIESGHQAYGSLPQGKNVAEAEQALSDKQGNAGNTLIHLLQDAVEMQDAQGLYIVSPNKREAVKTLLVQLTQV